MKSLAFPFLVILMAFTSTPSARADTPDDIRNQKKELEQVQRDVKRSQDRLDSLRREEKRLQKDINEYDQRMSSSQQVIARLNREMKQLSKQIADAEGQVGSQQEKLDNSQRRYLGNIRQLYLSTREGRQQFAGQPDDEMDMDRRVVYLTALANYESGTVAEASKVLKETAVELAELSGTGKQISNLKRQKEASYALEKARLQKRESTLEKLRGMSKDEADRVMTLQKSAEEMGDLIARLEKSQKVAPKPQPEVSKASGNFAALKGELPSPYRGKVILAYGTSVHPVTKLKSFSPGITIKGKPGDPVNAVSSGTVIYTGNLRGYGNFVIINHDNQYFTTYAGLDKIAVSTDQRVQAGTTVGDAADDGLVKFELRKGRQTLDPVEWIRIESF
ncbi:MAG TPA: peptidoglycan DD-metalloendopeptidase family protein [Candidatus Acidoferrum sp.]|nr:peptidoglycan DD-metalloendopeptidase family protein [Candidatus Acidoferrum sp.]